METLLHEKMACRKRAFENPNTNKKRPVRQVFDIRESHLTQSI
ncbi:hypothetical protein BAME_26070 [Bacillus sp. M 2-6]|nr:hypothetical protein BAME_26070 [Bacillus sp. M 2-6]